MNIGFGFVDIVEMIEASEIKSHVGDVQRELFCLTGVEVVLEVVRE